MYEITDLCIGVGDVVMGGGCFNVDSAANTEWI